MYKKFQLYATSPSGFFGEKKHIFAISSTWKLFLIQILWVLHHLQNKSYGLVKKCACIDFVLLKTLRALISIACAIVIDANGEVDNESSK